MLNPESFDPIELSRFTVFRVYYEYAGQRGEEKLYIVLRHAKEACGNACWCLKATSRTARYDADPEQLVGTVVYEANVLKFFYSKTIIDPRGLFCMPHSHLQKESNKRYRVEGKMPDDFKAKLITAIEKSDDLEPKKKKTLLAYLENPKAAT